MCKQLLTLLLLMILTGYTEAQHIRMICAGKPVSLRGLSVVNDKIIWASGSMGSVAISSDGGNNWKWIHVPGFEKSDFRDIEAFSDQEALIMGITDPAVILRTIDGGNSWTTVFRDTAKSVFLDAMDFSGDRGALVGDPIDGKIFFAESVDRGKNWNRKIPSGYDPTEPGEAFFAASGTNIVLIPGSGHAAVFSYALVSGGKKSCLYLPSKHYVLFINQGIESAGANSIAINPRNHNQAFIVGGDFKKDRLQFRNSLQIRFNTFSQKPPVTPPHGYRSCVEYLNDKQLICCGTTGVDISNDGGLNWTMISDKGFHVCRKAKSGNAVFLAGPEGSIARLDLKALAFKP
jgi:photosystem II stability/assembly factor-like uncharacterized protein